MQHIELKKCTTCNEEYPITSEYFYIDKIRKMYQLNCIQCIQEIKKKQKLATRKYYEKNKEKILEYNRVPRKIYYEQNKERLKLSEERQRNSLEHQQHRLGLVGGGT